MADVTSADGSALVVDEAYAKWHELSVLWLKRTFGKPEFTNKSTSRMEGYIRQLGLHSEHIQGGEFA